MKGTPPLLPRARSRWGAFRDERGSYPRETHGLGEAICSWRGNPRAADRLLEQHELGIVLARRVLARCPERAGPPDIDALTALDRLHDLELVAGLGPDRLRLERAAVRRMDRESAQPAHHEGRARGEELERISASQVMPEEKLGTLLDAIVGRLAGPSHWSTAVLVRELAAPSAHFAVLRDEEAPPKLRVALRILSDVSGIPIGAPELLCCLISVAAPCAMLLIAGDNLPAPGRDILRIDRRALADHLHRFALAGLNAAGQDYRARHEEDNAQLPA